jgi:hypothetical protein
MLQSHREKNPGNLHPTEDFIMRGMAKSLNAIGSPRNTTKVLACGTLTVSKNDDGSFGWELRKRTTFSPSAGHSVPLPDIAGTYAPAPNQGADAPRATMHGAFFRS